MKIIVNPSPQHPTTRNEYPKETPGQRVYDSLTDNGCPNSLGIQLTRWVAT
jgi:hypothetical protein